MSESIETNSSILKGPLFALAGYAVFSTHDAMLKSLGGDYSVFQIIFFAMLFGYVPFSLARVLDSNPGSIKAINPKMVMFRSLLMVGSLFSAFLAFSMLPLVEVYVLIFTAPLLISVLRPSVESVSLGHLLGLCAANCSAGFIAPMQYSQIVWAVIFGALFFNETVDQWGIAGALITVLSGMLILWREAKISKVRPNLSTRNTRMVSAAPSPVRESDSLW